MSGTEYCHPGEAEELSETFRMLCDASGVLGDYALYRLKEGEWVAGSEYQKLEDENAKLRELVSDMLPFAEVGMDDTCVTRRCCLYEQCEDVVGGPCIIEGHILGRMKELGIDVPNG